MSDEAESTLIPRSEGVVNLEMPFAALKEWVTPTGKLYVRCHFPIPEIDPAHWRLTVTGEVATPFEISYEELRALPQETVTATMECAGNGRSFLEPKVKGVQWALGAVGNAEWTGVRLGPLLERAGVRGSALEVILEGADRGEIKEPPRPPGEIRYARSLPLAKAQGDVLLALQLNGEPLSASHGFPLRAVVPGWFGMASVKWLERIVVTDAPFHGYYQSIDYTYWEERAGLPTLVPLAEMRTKAQIARPAPGETIAAGAEYRMHGAAWSGEREIVRVEISSDDGATWAEATLVDEARKHGWRFWEFGWRVPEKAGAYRVMARATDAAGETQPAARRDEYGTYMVNHCLPIDVQVQ